MLYLITLHLLAMSRFTGLKQELMDGADADEWLWDWQGLKLGKWNALLVKGGLK